MLASRAMSADPRTQWKEIVAPDEETRFRGYAEEIRGMQDRAAKGAKPGRALHLKSHTGAAAELTVRADLPDELRVAIFAKAGPSRCFVRFSNGVGTRQKDGVPDVRGLALKVLDVPGLKLIAGLEGATTQDLLFITAPAFAIGSPDDFLKLLRVVERGPLHLVPGLVSALGWGRALRFIKDLVTRPQPSSLATAHFYTGVPPVPLTGSCHSLARITTLDLGGGLVADRRVESSAVVEGLDVLEDRGSQLAA